MLCSYVGPDRHAYYTALARPAYLLWSISVAVAIAWLFAGRRHARYLPIALILAVFAAVQPAWWMRADMGDCGTMRSLTGGTVASASVLIFVFALRRARIRAGG